LKRVSQQKSTFFGGAAILAAGIAIVKVIGALYKIPIANILGDEGNGHFSNAYVIYNLLLMVSTAGLPVALSKTIAEAHTLGWKNQVNRIFRVALLTFLILGIISFAVMFQFAEPLARWQGDSLAVNAVRALAPACFFVCIISAFRGYAQGHSDMVPTSVSQIIEALGKLIIGVALAWYFMSINAGTEVAAAGAIFGVTAGAGIALIFLILSHKHREVPATLEQAQDTPDSTGKILKRLLVIAVPITLGASVVPITTWLDTYQVQNILRTVMQTESAEYYKALNLVDPVVAAYGSYQKAINVFNLPSSFMVALTACIIPAISACWTKRDQLGVGRIAESSLRVGSLLAFPAGIGLTALASPIMRLLYLDTNHAVADPCMLVLGIASIFVCLMFICNAILQASGFVNLPIFAMLLGCIAKLMVNNYLVRQEGIGIVGAPIGTLTCYVIVSVLELIIIKRVMPRPPSYIRIFMKPMIAAILMGVGAYASYGLLSKLLLGISRFQSVVEGSGDLALSLLGNAVATMGAIGVGVIIYVALIVTLKAISKEDLLLMPKGEKIAQILRLRD
jgi:stage V sporulation protein B